MECFYLKSQVHTQRIIPTGLPELSFYLGSQISSNDDKRSFNACSILTGQQKKYFGINATGHLKMISITFQPYGLATISNLVPSELLNQTIDASFIWGQEIKLLCEQLYEIHNIDLQIKLIEDFLTQSINPKLSNYKHQRINQLIPQINPVKHCISDLANQSYWSRKQFERSFTTIIGCTPKTFLNTIRFQYALHLKAQHPNVSLLDLALSCGYYDQAHMSNDFVKISGLSPKQFFNSCPSQSDYFGI
ncbi:MAG: helix-turn-helix domain-containing protein [Carboxylicivirga sp.]|jgi:AraC-like DNA-binding protein|nr:helix-turn-helix domain-containing protein [Carboxylicivirga sp.]